MTKRQLTPAGLIYLRLDLSAVHPSYFSVDVPDSPIILMKNEADF